MYIRRIDIIDITIYICMMLCSSVYTTYLYVSEMSVYYIDNFSIQLTLNCSITYKTILPYSFNS